MHSKRNAHFPSHPFTFSLGSYALPELSKTRGYLIIVSSVAAQLRFPNSSDYGLSKHALNRLGEFVFAEHPEVKTITVHPGCIMTEMVEDIPQLHQYAIDTTRLPACTMLRLTSGREDWLNGRYVTVLTPHSQRWRSVTCVSLGSAQCLGSCT